VEALLTHATGGDQRDRARAKNASKAKAKGKGDLGSDKVARMERDAKILRDKQVAADAKRQQEEAAKIQAQAPQQPPNK
jgi:hypothetical protein